MLAAHLDAGLVGQSRIEHRDIRLDGGYADTGFGRRARLPDDRDVVLLLKEVAQPSPYDLVVVDEEDADHDCPLGTAQSAPYHRHCGHGP